jgi:hypothetical protein
VPSGSEEDTQAFAIVIVAKIAAASARGCLVVQCVFVEEV